MAQSYVGLKFYEAISKIYVLMNNKTDFSIKCNKDNSFDVMTNK